jgi:hypothetical protein
VLFVVIPTAWLAVLFFALAMCRLAAYSDDSQTLAVAERLRAGDLGRRDGASADAAADHLSPGSRRGVYRATG